MGLATAVCLRRIFRFSWLGHQSWLLPPSVGYRKRPPFATGQPPEPSSFISPTTASGVSATGNPSAIRGCGAGGAQAPVDDLGLVDHEAMVLGRGEAGRVADGAVDIGDDAARAAHEVVVVVADAG